MMSKLTEQVEKFELMLRAVDATERSKAYNAILELTSFVRELSRKIDKLAVLDVDMLRQDDADEFLNMS